MNRRIEVVHGDCLEVMRGMDEASVDAVVTDPPYELGFMGKRWDSSGVAFQPETWVEALRVAKPGAHLCAFGGTRTYHRMACAIEDAGWEIRDCLQWLYATGFPKNTRVSRDARFCQCGEPGHSAASSTLSQSPQLHRNTAVAASDGAHSLGGVHRSTGTPSGSRGGCLPDRGSSDGRALPQQAAAPAPPQPQGCAQGHSHFDEREDAQGGAPSHTHHRSHSARPASMDSCLHEAARVEPDGGTLENSRRSRRTATGTDSLASRTSHNSESLLASEPPALHVSERLPVCQECGKPEANGWGTALKPAVEPIVLARKPLIGTVAANVLEFGTGGVNVDGCRVEGDYETRDRDTEGGVSMFGTGAGGGAFIPASGRWPPNVLVDEAAAASIGREARVFPTFRYEAKASRSEREAGCGHLPERTGAEAVERTEGSAGVQNPRAGAGRTASTVRNFHPTVKPIALMRWLVRLITPPGGVVLDPFAGSGTTVCAAALEGLNGVGIEQDAEHCEIARARIAHWKAKGHQPSLFTVQG